MIKKTISPPPHHYKIKNILLSIFLLKIIKLNYEKQL